MSARLVLGVVTSDPLTAAGVALRRMEAVVTVSILAHGASVKPLMDRYANHQATRETGR